MADQSPAGSGGSSGERGDLGDDGVDGVGGPALSFAESPRLGGGASRFARTVAALSGRRTTRAALSLKVRAGFNAPRGTVGLRVVCERVRGF
jgi:hypothetical protein